MSSDLFDWDPHDEAEEEPAPTAPSQGSDQHHHISDNLSLSPSLEAGGPEEPEQQPAAEPPEQESDHPPRPMLVGDVLGRQLLYRNC